MSFEIRGRVVTRFERFTPMYVGVPQELPLTCSVSVPPPPSPPSLFFPKRNEKNRKLANLLRQKEGIYPLNLNRVASNRPSPSLGATFRRRYELVKSITYVSRGKVNYTWAHVHTLKENANLARFS